MMNLSILIDRPDRHGYPAFHHSSRPGQRTAAGHAPGRRAVPPYRGVAAVRAGLRRGAGAGAVPFRGARAGVPAQPRRGHPSAGYQRRGAAAARRRAPVAVERAAGTAVQGHRHPQRHRAVPDRAWLRRRRRLPGRAHPGLQRLHGIRSRRHAIAGGCDARGDAGRHPAEQQPGTARDARRDGARIAGAARGFGRHPGAAGRRGIGFYRARLGGVRLRRRQRLGGSAARSAPGQGAGGAAPRPGPPVDGGGTGRADGQLALGVRRTLSRRHRHDPAALSHRTAHAPCRAVAGARPRADRERGLQAGLWFAGRFSRAFKRVVGRPPGALRAHAPGESRNAKESTA